MPIALIPPTALSAVVICPAMYVGAGDAAALLDADPCHCQRDALLVGQHPVRFQIGEVRAHGAAGDTARPAGPTDTARTGGAWMEAVEPAHTRRDVAGNVGGPSVP